MNILPSSIRFIKNVEDMDNASGNIFNLRPVTFEHIQSVSDIRKYGLVAEEVEKVMPSLVLYDKSESPESVRYHELPVLLLNELKKLSAKVKKLEETISKCCCQEKCHEI